MRDRRRVRWPAWLAAGLAFASAGVSAHWTLGGGLLLDTVGGDIERLARERSAGALALGATTVLLKVLAGILAIGLALAVAVAAARRDRSPRRQVRSRGWTARPPRRPPPGAAA